MSTRALRPPRWTERAACAQADPDAWFPEKGGTVTRVKAICRRCPVREPCLGYALDRGETHGVWGGLSHDERERAAGPYRQGVSLGVIIAGSDARGAAAAEQSREHARAASAAYAARHAGLESAA